VDKSRPALNIREVIIPSQTDIFDRAAACDRASRIAVYEQRRVALELLRDMWIAVANEAPYLSRAALVEQVDVVEGISDCLCGPSRSGGASTPGTWTQARPPGRAA
jgi:hypothetical protein